MKKGSPSQNQLQSQIKCWRQDFEKLHTQARETKAIPKNRESGARQDKGNAKRAAGELKIKAALREKDALIREIRHRLVSHLNLIYNILYFRKQYSNDSRSIAILESTQKQIKTIALVHEHLQHSMDFNRVRFGEYLKGLLREITNSADWTKKKIALKTKIESVSIDLTTAITCGLIVNELLDNSLKHAFPVQRRAEVFVGLHGQKDGTVALTVRDNGSGLPPEVQWHLSSTMGSFLVNVLTENLKGELTVDVNGGTAFLLRFSPFPQ